MLVSDDPPPLILFFSSSSSSSLFPPPPPPSPPRPPPPLPPPPPPTIACNTDHDGIVPTNVGVEGVRSHGLTPNPEQDALTNMTRRVVALAANSGTTPRATRMLREQLPWRQVRGRRQTRGRAEGEPEAARGKPEEPETVGGGGSKARAAVHRRAKAGSL